MLRQICEFFIERKLLDSCRFGLFFCALLLTQGGKDWMGNESDALKGFPWKGGSERTTSGILMWSEPFEVLLPSGEPVFVLLMDTQVLNCSGVTTN